MNYGIIFVSEKFDTVSSWIEDLEVDFKFQINDKICILDDSFQSNLFTEQNDSYFDMVVSELNLSSNDKDSVPLKGMGQYLFFISDIEYVFVKNNETYGRIYLSKCE